MAAVNTITARRAAAPVQAGVAGRLHSLVRVCAVQVQRGIAQRGRDACVCAQIGRARHRVGAAWRSRWWWWWLWWFDVVCGGLRWFAVVCGGCGGGGGVVVASAASLAVAVRSTDRR
jgi:hypothetical protein